MKTEHYDPPIADEQAEYERAAELHHAASKIHEKLLSEINEIDPELQAARTELSTAKEKVSMVEKRIFKRLDAIYILNGFICEEFLEREEEEEDDYADGFWPQGLEE